MAERSKRDYTVYHHLQPANVPGGTRPIIYPVAHIQDVFLEEVFRATNSIDQSWVVARDSRTLNMTIMLRSTSVGDIVMDNDNGDWFRVASRGFEQLEDDDKAQYLVMRNSMAWI